MGCAPDPTMTWSSWRAFRGDSVVCCGNAGSWSAALTDDIYIRPRPNPYKPRPPARRESPRLDAPDPGVRPCHRAPDTERSRGTADKPEPATPAGAVPSERWSTFGLEPLLAVRDLVKP